MARAMARVAAMQLIFEHFAGGEGGMPTLQMIYDELLAEHPDGMTQSDPGMADRAWIERVLQGVIENQEELDERIQAVSKNWRIERMAQVDLTILRLAAWELLYETDVPGSVVINEAVEMANTYASEGSGRFINGILGTILRLRETP